MRVAAIVFDFDGVIADTEPLHLRTYQEVLAPLGITLTRDDYYAHLLGYDDVAVFERVGADAGRPFESGEIAALVERKTQVFARVAASTEVLYPGAAACIERMARVCPLGIASGALRHEIVEVLHRSGLERHFRFIVSAGDTPRGKPHPDPYRLAAELHGVAAGACVALEDSRWGLESARAAGLRSVAVTHTYPPEALGTADAVITSLDAFTPELLAELPWY